MRPDRKFPYTGSGDPRQDFEPFKASQAVNHHDWDFERRKTTLRASKVYLFILTIHLENFALNLDFVWNLIYSR